MATMVSLRLDDELMVWVTRYAEQREVSRSALIEQAVRDFRELAKGGVPDLPVALPAVERERRFAAEEAEAEAARRAFAAGLGARVRKLNEAKERETERRRRGGKHPGIHG